MNLQQISLVRCIPDVIIRISAHGNLLNLTSNKYIILGAYLNFYEFIYWSS